ncbi:hypothetical protein [Flaviaesturariibacter amylovorans]|uniref:DUF4142 domain-containing protein n=1 Tax=Flaviaesturariibacter amylovorans TaxID=1084520 RepID=A0ABP8G512_9BACT
MLLLLGACGGSARRQEGPVVGASKADDAYFSKRASTDLLSELWADTLSRSAPLKALDGQVRAMAAQKADSLAAYDAYTRYSTRYYADAERYAASIGDTVLRGRVLALVRSSRDAQARRTAGHTALDSSLQKREAAIGDVHGMLKLLLTLPLMERYQQQKLPSRTPLEQLNRSWQHLEQRLDSLRRTSGG